MYQGIETRMQKRALAKLPNRQICKTKWYASSIPSYCLSSAWYVLDGGNVFRVMQVCENTKINDTPRMEPQGTHKPITRSNQKVSKHTGGRGQRAWTGLGLAIGVGQGCSWQSETKATRCSTRNYTPSQIRVIIRLPKKYSQKAMKGMGGWASVPWNYHWVGGLAIGIRVPDRCIVLPGPCYDHKSETKTHFGLTRCLRKGRKKGLGGGICGLCGQGQDYKLDFNGAYMLPGFLFFAQLCR